MKKFNRIERKSIYFNCT